MIGVSVLVSLLGLLFVTFLASISSPCSCYCCCCFCCCLPLHRLQALHSPSSPSSSEAAWSSPSSPFGFGFFPFVLLLNMRFFPLEIVSVSLRGNSFSESVEDFPWPHTWVEFLSWPSPPPASSRWSELVHNARQTGPSNVARNVGSYKWFKTLRFFSPKTSYLFTLPVLWRGAT